jgi:hypothetical protein
MNRKFLILVVSLLILMGTVYVFSQRPLGINLLNESSTDTTPTTQENSREQTAYASAIQAAKAMSPEELRTEIVSTHQNFTSSGNRELIPQLSAYISEYLSSYPDDSQISEINDLLVTEFGPCYGLPEGQCQE